jgi:hypothetical protein
MWVLNPEADFDGLQVGPMFRVTRSRTNFDPAIHTGPGWVNIDPDEPDGLVFGDSVPDCAGDVTLDHAVDVDDLLVVINEWGNPGGMADAASDGIIDVNDLLIVINAWGRVRDHLRTN